MTDFETRILDEDAAEPPQPVLDAARADPRRRIAAQWAMETRDETPDAPAGAPAPAGQAPPAVRTADEASRETAAHAAARPDRSAVAAARAALTGMPGATTGGARAEPAPTPQTAAQPAPPPRTGSRAADRPQHEGAAAHAARARREALTATLAALAQTPEDVRLAPLLDAYEAAPEAELAQAAGALVALYLRAGTDTRRRLRPVLAEALRRGAATPLGAALSARLGAVAMPPSRPPEPDP